MARQNTFEESSEKTSPINSQEPTSSINSQEPIELPSPPSLSLDTTMGTIGTHMSACAADGRPDEQQEVDLNMESELPSPTKYELPATPAEEDIPPKYEQGPFVAPPTLHTICEIEAANPVTQSRFNAIARRPAEIEAQPFVVDIAAVQALQSPPCYGEGQGTTAIDGAGLHVVEVEHEYCGIQVNDPEEIWKWTIWTILALLAIYYIGTSLNWGAPVCPRGRMC